MRVSNESARRWGQRRATGTHLDTGALKDAVEALGPERLLKQRHERLCGVEAVLAADARAPGQDEDLVGPALGFCELELALVNIDGDDARRAEGLCHRAREQADGACAEDEDRRPRLGAARPARGLDDDRQRLGQRGLLVRDVVGEPASGGWRSATEAQQGAIKGADAASARTCKGSRPGGP